MWLSGRHRDQPAHLQPGKQQRMAGPDQSTSTWTEAARRHHLRPSADRTRRPSDGARREMLEHFREQLKVALVTTACFGWNCASVLARSSDSWLPRLLGFPGPSYHWTTRVILDIAHSTNALSDVILIICLYYLQRPNKDDEEQSLYSIIRFFVLWNGVTTLLIWCASCVDAFLPRLPAQGPVTTSINGETRTTVSPEEASVSAWNYILAGLGYTAVAGIKALILLSIYVDYLCSLQEESAVTAAEIAIYCQESTYSQPEEQSTWDRFFWRRKGSRHSKQPSSTSTSKHHSGGNSPSVKQSARPTAGAEAPSAQTPALLENWFQPGGELRHVIYDDEDEGAPLQVVPNRDSVSYVWRPAAASTSDSKQTAAAVPKKPSRGMPSFDAMQMALFGGRNRLHGRAEPQGSAERGEESLSSTANSTVSATPSRASRKKEGAPSSPEFNFEAYLEQRRQAAAADAVPVLPDGSSSDNTASSDIPSVQPQAATANDASAPSVSTTQAAAAMQVQHTHGDLKQQTPRAGLASDEPTGHLPEQTASCLEPSLLPLREAAISTDVVEENENEAGQGVPRFLSSDSHVTSTNGAENQKNPLFLRLDTNATTLDKEDSAGGPPDAVTAAPTTEITQQPASVIRVNQDDGPHKEHATGALDIAKSESESQRPGTEQSDTAAVRGVLPPLTLSGPVLVKDRRKSRKKTDAQPAEERQVLPCADTQLVRATSAGGADALGKQDLKEDVKQHEASPEEDHTTEMVTGAFSVETEKN